MSKSVGDRRLFCAAIRLPPQTAVEVEKSSARCSAVGTKRMPNRDYSGVEPREISEIVTHLAFYSGWENAASAVTVAKDVVAARKIGADQLPAASPQALPLDKEAENKRAASVEQQFGAVALLVMQYNTVALTLHPAKDVWLRSVR